MNRVPVGQTAAVVVRERVIGERYVLLEELGRGGMAVVWRARDEVLGRSVAIKLLDGPSATDPVSRMRIRDEARAAAALSHPHIARIYDYGETLTGGDRVPYVVMELVHGSTLQELAGRGPVAPDELIRLGGQIASALAAAHAERVVHRDIKPANIMVTGSGAKVVDFGIAAAAGLPAADEELLGTPATWPRSG
nr:serine/threonine-protein kinase [Actinoplanes sp. TFC3]